MKSLLITGVLSVAFATVGHADEYWVSGDRISGGCNITTSQPVTFSLRFRVPGWTAAPVEVDLNDQTLSVTAEPGRWAEITRSWQNGDTLKIRLPMELAFAPVDRQHPRRIALTYGPVVLVADRGPRWPWGGTLGGALEDPSAWIERTERPLTFQVQNETPGRTFRPFYELGQDETYWMYFDLLPG